MSGTTQASVGRRGWWKRAGLASLSIAALALIVSFPRWWPAASAGWARLSAMATKADAADSADEHDHAEHDHAEHGDGDFLELSPQARANIGLKLAQVELKSYERTIAVPAIVAERPGRSTVEITAPLTGVVTRIHPILGEAVAPGQPLFELRLTHEELVQAQGDFLRTVEELDVIGREVKRLEQVTGDGIVAGKNLLERRYEQQRQQAVLRAQQQALLLHGLSRQQVDAILSQRTLLQTMLVSVPEEPAEVGSNAGPPLYQIQQLRVEKGQHVTAGDTLAVLTDHAELFLEGNAFERDIPDIHRAVENNRPVTAVMQSPGNRTLTIPNLRILYLSGKVDAASREFHFYVTLPNTLLRDSGSDAAHRFISWQFKPGQRMQLLVPVENWERRIVLPVDAVAQDGAETYVFQANGKRLERRPVHVEHRDPLHVVIANDGSLFPGDTVALSGAAQLQLALKNKSGGPVDPHAGHSH